MHARHPGIARRWDAEEKAVSKVQPRYGNGTSGRRMALSEPADVEKGLKDVGRALKHEARYVRNDPKGYARDAARFPAKAAAYGALRGGELALRPVKRGVRRLDDAKARRQFGKRLYNPEDRRQRRIGMGEAALLGAGGILGFRGGRGLVRTTRGARKLATFASNMKGAGPRELAVANALSRGVTVRRRDLAQLGGGAAGIAGAGALRQHAESRAGRAYN